MTTDTIALAHITLASGHVTMVPHGEGDPGAIAEAAQLIDVALEHGAAQMASRPGFGITVERFGGALLVTVLAIAPGMARLEHIVAFGIASRARQGRMLWAKLETVAGTSRRQPPAPWCGVVLLPALGRHVEALEWLGPFEQAVAWAWLERGE